MAKKNTAETLMEAAKRRGYWVPEHQHTKICALEAAEEAREAAAKSTKSQEVAK